MLNFQSVKSTACSGAASNGIQTWAPKGLLILYDDKDYVAISDPENIALDEGLTGTRTTKKLLATTAEVAARIAAFRAANPTAPDPPPQNKYFEWQIEAMQIVQGGQKRDVYKENRGDVSAFTGNVAVYINFLFSFSGYGGGPLSVFTDVDWPYRWRIDQAAIAGGAYKATLDTPSTQAFKMGMWKTVADPTPLGMITFEAGATDGTVELFGDITFADETEVLFVQEWDELPTYALPSSDASNLRVYLAANSIRGDGAYCRTTSETARLPEGPSTRAPRASPRPASSATPSPSAAAW